MENSKTCTKCGKSKPLSEFSKSKSAKDGFNGFCKICDSNRRRVYQRTFKGLVYGIYNNQIKSSKKREHKPPTYSKSEFLGYCSMSDKFVRLYNEWVKSGYNKELVPSIDRLDDYKGYSLDNIQVITFRENYKKAHRDMVEGRNNKRNKAVLQYDKQGNFIKEYHSVRQAGRELGISAGNISSACNGMYDTMGGFVWKYK